MDIVGKIKKIHLCNMNKIFKTKSSKAQVEEIENFQN